MNAADLHDGADAQTPHTSPGLQVERLRLHQGQRCLLDAVSLQLRPGELLALVGGADAGGHALLHLLLGLDLPPEHRVSGDIWLDGRALQAWPRAQRVARVALVPTPVAMALPCSVAEVVALGLESRLAMPRDAHSPAANGSARVAAVLQQLGIGAWAQQACCALDDGQRQQVLLARALVQEARYLLVELPPLSAQAALQWPLWPLLQALARRGLGILVSTDQVDAARTHADRVLALQAPRGAKAQHADQRPVVAPAPARPRPEHLIASLQGQLADAEGRLARALELLDQQRQELLALEAELCAGLAPHPDTAAQQAAASPLQQGLQHKRLLYVGGRPSSLPSLRRLVEHAGGHWLQHNGRPDEAAGQLAGLLSKVDLVVFPTEQIDPQARQQIQRLCRQHRVPYRPLRSTSLASRVTALALQDPGPPLANGAALASPFCLRHG